MTPEQIQKMAEGFPPSSIGKDHEEVVTWLVQQHIQLQGRVKALAVENKRAIDAVTIFSNVTHDITEIICDELGQGKVAEILSAYNELGNTPQTDAFIAEIKAQGVDDAINSVCESGSQTFGECISVMGNFAVQLRAKPAEAGK